MAKMVGMIRYVKVCQSCGTVAVYGKARNPYPNCFVCRPSDPNFTESFTFRWLKSWRK